MVGFQALQAEVAKISLFGNAPTRGFSLGFLKMDELSIYFLGYASYRPRGSQNGIFWASI